MAFFDYNYIYSANANDATFFFEGYYVYKAHG